MTRSWTTSITAVCANRWVRGAALTVYYLAIIAGLVALYGKGDFSSPKFIYQGF